MNILDELEFLVDFSDLLSIPIIGSEKGEWLLDFIIKHQSGRILELGTAIAYSTLILASQKAEVITIDRDIETVVLARDNISRFNYDITIIEGDGVKKAKELSEDKKFRNYFDLIFMDFEKSKYITIFPYLTTMLSAEGYIIADNINNQKVQQFNDYIRQNSEYKTDLINMALQTLLWTRNIIFDAIEI